MNTLDNNSSRKDSKKNEPRRNSGNKEGFSPRQNDGRTKKIWSHENELDRNQLGEAGEGLKESGDSAGSFSEKRKFSFRKNDSYSKRPDFIKRNQGSFGFQKKKSFQILYNRKVTKVIKGGPVRTFSVIGLYGLSKSTPYKKHYSIYQVGLGHGRAKEIIDARTKATEQAKKNLRPIIFSNKSQTIPCPLFGKHCATSVELRPMHKGNDIKASKTVIILFNLLGLKNVICKIRGSKRPYNVIKALLKAFEGLYDQIENIYDYTIENKVTKNPANGYREIFEIIQAQKSIDLAKKKSSVLKEI